MARFSKRLGRGGNTLSGISLNKISRDLSLKRQNSLLGQVDKGWRAIDSFRENLVRKGRKYKEKKVVRYSFNPEAKIDNQEVDGARALDPDHSVPPSLDFTHPQLDLLDYWESFRNMDRGEKKGEKVHSTSL